MVLGVNLNIGKLVGMFSQVSVYSATAIVVWVSFFIGETTSLGEVSCDDINGLKETEHNRLYEESNSLLNCK
eukprot:SAG11_NODE_2045_length_3886_cov_1.810932_2_plen_72_part_00